MYIFFISQPNISSVIIDTIQGDQFCGLNANHSF